MCSAGHAQVEEQEQNNWDLYWEDEERNDIL